MNKPEYHKAIIINDGKIILEYNEFGEEGFFFFPGGKPNEEETPQEFLCRIGEQLEVTIEPKREVYIYENDDRIEHFHLCEWKEGNLEKNNFTRNLFGDLSFQLVVGMNRFEELPILPKEVAKRLHKDFKWNKQSLFNSDEVLIIRPIPRSR